MNDFTLKTNRGQMLKSLMRSPETAKLLKEAISSPLGSTSRIKAKKIFSIMSKLHTYNEGFGGQGGPGDPTAPASPLGTAQSQTPDFTPKGMVMFNKIPKTKIVYGNSPNIVKSQSQYLNEMVNFNHPKPDPNLNVPSAFNASTTTHSGQGGPGYNGRGGFFSNVWNGITTGVSNATNAVKNLFTPTPTPAPAVWDRSNQNSIASIAKNDNSIAKSSIPYYVDSTPANKAATTPTGNSTTGPGTLAYNSALKTMGGGAWSPTAIESAAKSKQSETPAGWDTSNPNSIASISTTKATPVSTPENITSTPTTSAPTIAGTTLGTGTSRTDRNNNPTAFTTDIARQAGLVEGVDYEKGEAFPDNPNLFTAKIIGNPIDQTIKVIDKIGFTTQAGGTRWSYTNSIPGANNSEWQNLSKEQKTAVIAQMYQYENGGGSGILSPVQKAVSEATGPATFATQETEKALGGSYADLMKKNKEALDAKYNITSDQEAVSKMKEENLNLPEDVTNYIKGRDKYIEQTDKEIDKFIKTSMDSTDMSNPENAAKANAQLNYLYTLRGRQNQSYIGYLNNAVTQHTNELNSKIDSLNSNIDLYKADLANANTITENQYNLTLQKFTDEYTALKNAPVEAYNEAILKAQATAAGDPMSAIEKKNILDQGKALEGVIWTAGKRYVMPGVNLAETVNQIMSDPTTGVEPATVVASFKQGIYNYLEAPLDKDGQTGDGVTSASKINMAKYGVKELNSLATLYQSMGYNTEAKQLLDYADELNNYTVNLEQSKYESTGQMSNVINAIKNIDQGRNWYTLGIAKDAPLSEADFIKDFSSKTGNTLDESIAKAIYAVYQRYYNDEVSSGRKDTATQEAIKQLLTMTQVDENGNQVRVPVTDATIAKRIAQIVATGQ